LLSYSIVWKI